MSRVISDNKVKDAIKARDEHTDFRLESIHTKIIRRESNSNLFRMIVRVGFDYMQRIKNENIREDIFVDIAYYRNKNSGSEKFEILNVTFVPELPNP